MLLAHLGAHNDLRALLVHKSGPLYPVFCRFIDFLFPFKVPTGPYFWPGLLSFFIIGALLYARRGTAAGARSVGATLRYLFPKEIYAHPNAALSFKYYLLFGTLNAIVPYVTFFMTMNHAGSWVEGGLRSLFGPSVPIASPTGPFVALGFTVMLFVAVDFAAYVQHVLFHKLPVLWEFHKVHHCVTAMQPLATTQIHPIEAIVQGLFIVLFGGVAIGTARYLFGAQPPEITLLGASILVAAVRVLVHLRHSHIWLAFPRGVSRIFSSPAMHQIHHSTAPRHLDRNFGQVFSVWDWLFGTIYVPAGFEALEVGLRDEPTSDFDSVWKLLALPFAKAARILMRQQPPARVIPAAHMQACPIGGAPLNPAASVRAQDALPQAASPSFESA